MAKEKVKVVEKGGLGFVGFLTYIGAAIYFIDRADGFWEIIVALLKAAVWPAFLVNKIFTVLQIT